MKEGKEKGKATRRRGGKVRKFARPVRGPGWVDSRLKERKQKKGKKLETE